MKTLSKSQVKVLVMYSPKHIAWLEKAGHFPKWVLLDPNRVGRVEREVRDWLEERLAQRQEPNRHSWLRELGGQGCKLDNPTISPLPAIQAKRSY